MITTHEDVLEAVRSALAGTGVPVSRNTDRPERLPLSGQIILMDGDPGEPEILMSPLIYQWERVAEIAVLAQPSAAHGAKTLGDLLPLVRNALAADRSFGGVVDYSEPGAPAHSHEAPDGVPTLRRASIPLTLVYDTEDPVG